jgi:hypothetical protein
MWITEIFEDVSHVPLNKILLPGSHDTATYKFDLSIPLNGNKPLFNKITQNRFIRMIAGQFAIKWAKCHDLNFIEQLSMGIRFFDLRVTLFNNEIYFAHSFATMRMQELIDQIKQFYNKSDNHIKEPIVLSFKIEGYNSENMKSLHSKKIFWKKLMQLYKYIYPIVDNRIPTLSDIYSSKKPIIILMDRPLLYDNNKIIYNLFKEEILIDNKCVLIPHVLPLSKKRGKWHNTFNVEETNKKVIKEIQNIQNNDTFYHIQGIITPQDNNVTNGIICLVLKILFIIFIILTILSVLSENKILIGICVTISICLLIAWIYRGCAKTAYSLKTHSKTIQDTIFNTVKKHDINNNVSIITSDFTNADFIKNIIEENKKRRLDMVL